MRALALPWRSLDLFAAVNAGWRWWVSELTGMLPPPLVDLMRARQSRVVLEVTADQVQIARARAGVESEMLCVAASDAGGIKGMISAGDSVELRLPRSEALCKPLELPLGAARNLADILRFELDRQSPLEPERVYFDHRILRHDKVANKLVVELRIVKRDAVDRAVALCRSLGVEPVSLDFGPNERAFDLAAVLGGARRSSGGWRWRRSTAALAILSAVFATATGYVEWARERQALSDVDARLVRAKADAQEATRLRKEVEALAARTELLTREKAKPLRVTLLSDITRLLPDGTWLSQLEIHGTSIRMRGYSPAASQLLAVFDGSPLFTSTRFEAPVTQGPRPGLERFDLSFELRGEKP
jgi:general secretion pathway protein L